MKKKLGKKNPWWQSRVWFVFLGVIFFAQVIIMSCRQMDAMDVGYQMAFARLTRQGQWPQTEPFTFTSNLPYVCLNWLFDNMALSLFNFGGFIGMSLYQPVTILLVFLLLYIGGRKMWQVQWRPFMWLGLLALVAVQFRFGMCSEQMAIIWAVIVLLVNEKYRQTQNGRWLIILPIVQVLWINTQATFPLAWLIVGSYFLASWWENRRLDWRLAGVGVLVVAASWCNPYGTSGAIFPWQSLSWFGGDDYFKNTISEYYSLPKFITENHLPIAGWWKGSTECSMWALLLYILVLMVTYIGNYKRVEKPQWFLATILLVMTYQTNRIAIFLVLLTFLPLTKMLGEGKEGLGWIYKLIGVGGKRWQRGYLQMKIFYYQKCHWVSDILWLILVSGLSLVIINNQFYGINVSHFGWGLQESVVPYQAVQKIATAGWTGKIINEYLYGGWLAFAQANPIYITGHLEVMGEKLYRESEYIQTEGKVKALIQKYQPAMIFYRLSRDEPYTTIYQNLKKEKWQLVYVDRVAVIWMSPEEMKKQGVQEMNWDELITAQNLKRDWSDEEMRAVIEKEYRRPAITDFARFLNQYGVISRWATLLNILGDYERSNIMILNYFAQTEDYDEAMYQVMMNNYWHLKDQKYLEMAENSWQKTLERVENK